MAATQRSVLDHVAIGTSTLADGWQLFGGLLGGQWAYGGDSPGYWWGQLAFAGGPKIELLTPTGGPDAGFLERFLSAHGPGAHHFNFLVADINETLSSVRALGIEPVGVNLLNARWKEAFLHPRDAYGIVIQIAEQSIPPASCAPPADLPAPGPAANFALVEHEVSDLDGAVRLFSDVLGGRIADTAVAGGVAAAELSWPDGAHLRLAQGAAATGTWRTSGGLTSLCFQPAAPLSDGERADAAGLAGRLGLPLTIG